jgi:diaminopimelate epimerase
MVRPGASGNAAHVLAMHVGMEAGTHVEPVQVSTLATVVTLTMKPSSHVNAATAKFDVKETSPWSGLGSGSHSASTELTVMARRRHERRTLRAFMSAHY